MTFTVSDGSVTLHWKRAPDKDADHVVVIRSHPDGAGASTVARTKATQVTDRGLRNGTVYRYVIVQYDRAGNRSAGIAVIASPKANALVLPLFGTTIRVAPTLHWLQYPRATYYNVQLFRNGRKVLTAWPSTNRLTLTSSWLFAKTVVKFGPGRYTWFVWPGLGLVKDRHYGELLGQSWFVVK